MSAILTKLEDIVGISGVLTGTSVTDRVARWGTSERSRAAAIIRPASEGKKLAACLGMARSTPWLQRSQDD